MQLSNAPGKLVLPFANAGAKNTIPAASQIGITAGAASLTDGFPPLTRTPIAAGGVPPSGLDMNGILYALSAALRWANAGGGYVYDGTFAADSNVGGYPKGARVLRSDGAGYWLNTIDGNTVDPESVTVNQAQIAGWVPDLTNGVAAVTMTSANVTLTPLQYGKPVIVLSGTLTANLNLIFPNLAGEWTVVNNCTGAFTVTAKTAAGTGAVVTPGRTRIIWGDGTNIAGAMNEVETPAQFDATTKIATMAAVQRALGNLRSETAVNSSTTLDASAIGQLIVGSAGTYTTTIPLANSVPPGSCIWFEGTSGIVTWLVQRQGTDIIDNNGGGTFFSLGTGGTAILESNGVGTWRIIGGSAALRNAADFGASTASAGYQKLPSGLIIQWGSGIYGTATAVSFPIAFPNTCRQVIIGAGNYDGAQAAFQKVSAIAAYSLTTSGFTASSSTGNGSAATWVAIGF